MEGKRNPWDSSDITLALLLGGSLLGAGAGLAKAHYTDKEISKNDRDLLKYNDDKFIDLDTWKDNTYKKNKQGEKEEISDILEDKEAAAIASGVLLSAAPGIANTAGGGLKAGLSLYTGYAIYDIVKNAWDKGLSNPISTYVTSDRSVVKDLTLGLGSMYAMYKGVNYLTDKKMLSEKKDDFDDSEDDMNKALSDEMNRYYPKDKLASIDSTELGLSDFFSSSGRSRIGEGLGKLVNSTVIMIGAAALAAVGVSALGSYSLTRRALDSNTDVARLRKLGKLRKENGTDNRFEV